MKLEVGKEYRTRDGRRAQLNDTRHEGLWAFAGRIDGHSIGLSWTETGRWDPDNLISDYDLVAEWDSDPAAAAAGPQPQPDPTPATESQPDPVPDPLRGLILATFENPESWPATDGERIALLRRLYLIAKGGTQ